jgi:hypothetical protein
MVMVSTETRAVKEPVGLERVAKEYGALKRVVFLWKM